MSWDFARDLARSFTGPGATDRVVVEVGGQVTTGYVTDAQELAGDGQHRMTKLERRSVTIVRDSLTDLVVGTEVVVGGDRLVLRDTLRVDDGRLLELVLVAAEA